jgi:hypothetical protein
MPNGPGRVRSAKTQRNPLVTLMSRRQPQKMTRTMYMPGMRLHVHNGGDSKIPILQKAPRA